MDGATLLLYALIAVALPVDFPNGMHDAAISIATIVSTRVLRPQYVVAGAFTMPMAALIAASAYAGAGWPR
jgi:phosphate/sulfate permease